MLNRIAILVLLFAIPLMLSAQSSIDSLLTKIDPQKWSQTVKKKVSTLESKLVDKSNKVLKRLQREEKKIYSRLLKGKDSILAQIKLEEIKSKYSGLHDQMSSSQTLIASKEYLPYLDSLQTAFKFLNLQGLTGDAKLALEKLQTFNVKFQQAAQIKQFIRERKQQLKEQLESLGIIKNLKKINKEVYYYSQQLNDFKNTLGDSKKIEKKAMEILSKQKFFKDFMRKNSLIAGLFRIPLESESSVNNGNLNSLAGLQTRAQVNNIIQQQIASGGVNARQLLQQNMQNAQAQLNEFKDKVLGAGGANENIMPEGFKKNDQKTKTFLKRLTYGVNIQSQRATNFFPTTSDVGLSIGFKINDASILGAGLSYKMGLGRGWNNISLSHEGIGLRTFCDLKLKGSIWMVGGYEQNFRSSFRRFSQLQDMNGWQKSGLLGISKKYNLTKKLKGSLQLLWDFLSYQEVPRAQSIIFRIGFSTK